MSAVGLGPPRDGIAAAIPLAGDDGAEGPAPASARGPALPLPLGPGNIKEVTEEEPQLSGALGDGTHETLSATPAPTVTLIEYDDDEQLPEDAGDLSADAPLPRSPRTRRSPGRWRMPTTNRWGNFRRSHRLRPRRIRTVANPR